VELAPPQLKLPMAFEQRRPGSICGAREIRALIDELQDRREIVELIFQRRAGHGPGALPAQLLDLAAHLRVAVLDPLGLVEHDQVPGPTPRKELRVPPK